MLSATCLRAASVSAFVFLTLAATASPCCRITAIDRVSGTVTAEEAATGTTFEFRLAERELDGLAVGTPVDADLDARVASIGDREVAIRKLSRGRPARLEQRDRELQTRSARPSEDARERKRGGTPREASARTAAAAPAETPDGRTARKQSSDRIPRSAEETAASEPPSDAEETSPGDGRPLSDEETAASALPSDGEETSPGDDRRLSDEETAASAPPIDGEETSPRDDRPRKARKPAAPVPPADSDKSRAGDSTVTATAPSRLTTIRGSRKPPRVPGGTTSGGTPPSGTPPPCYVSGCSGQVCSSQQNVITTCEYRPEYACYQTAQCARQPDGECRWTPTPELAACLSGSN